MTNAKTGFPVSLQIDQIQIGCCLQVNEEENEAVIQAVLPKAAELGFKLEKCLLNWPRRGLPSVDGAERLVRVDPNLDGTDGFFVACFARRKQCWWAWACDIDSVIFAA